MKTTVIYFIRHGELDNPRGMIYGRVIDIGLSQEGREKIEGLARQIKEQEGNVDIIYTSPLRRCLESATIISEAMNSVLIMKDELLTETDVPALVGRPITLVDEIEAKGLDMFTEDLVRAGNETREYVAARMVAAYKKISQENAGKKIIVIGHGDPLCMLFYRLSNPKGSIPLMPLVKRTYYPQKGEGWRMVLDENGNIIETTFVKGEKS